MATQNAGASATNTPRSNQTASKDLHFTHRFQVILHLTEAQLDGLLSDLEATITTDLIYHREDKLCRGTELVQMAFNVDYGDRAWDIVCAADIYRQLIPHWEGRGLRPALIRDEETQCRLRKKYGQVLAAPLGTSDPFDRKRWRTWGQIQKAKAAAAAREEVMVS